MYSDFYFNYCFFGGGSDGVSRNAVLCAFVFYFCEFDDFTFGIFVVEFIDGVCGGFSAGALSIKGTKHCVGFNDGAANTIYFKINCSYDCAGDNLGDCDDAAHCV